jgi:predicted nuclease with TOPRIM domain
MDNLKTLENELVEFRDYKIKINENKELIETVRKEKEKIEKIEAKEIELRTEKDILNEIDKMKKRCEEKVGKYKDIVKRLKSIVYNKGAGESNMSVSSQI